MPYTPLQAARRLGVSEPTILGWIEAGLLVANPTRRGYRIPNHAVDNMGRYLDHADNTAVELLCRRCGELKPATPRHFATNDSGKVNALCQVCKAESEAWRMVTNKSVLPGVQRTDVVTYPTREEDFDLFDHIVEELGLDRVLQALDEMEAAENA